MRRVKRIRGVTWAAVVLVAFTAAFCATAVASRGWETGRLPGLKLWDTSDMVCGGTFVGGSVPFPGPAQWREGGWIVRPETRKADFLVDAVIKGDPGLTGSTIQVLYEASLPPVGGVAHIAGGTEFPDLAQKLGKRRCLLQLLSPQDGVWEIRFRGDSYMALGAKPEVADWASLSGWQRLEQEFASAILDPDPVVAAYAIASAANQPSPAGGPVLTAALRKREAGEPLWLAREATRGLVGIGDLDAIYGLPQTLQEWRSQPAPYPSLEISDVCAFNPVPQIRTRNAVPALVELSQDAFSGTRYSAVVALGTIGGNDTKAALAARLDDEDPEIRHAASWGLGRGLEPKDVGAKDWKGWLDAADIYDRDPEKVLNNWRNWWQTKGKDKYPSVEAELAKAERFRTERPWAHEAQPAE